MQLDEQSIMRRVISLPELLKGSSEDPTVNGGIGHLSPAVVSGLDSIYKKMSKYFKNNPNDNKTVGQIEQVIDILINESE